MRRILSVQDALQKASAVDVLSLGSKALVVAWLSAGRASAAYIGLHLPGGAQPWNWCAAHAIGRASDVTFFRLDPTVPPARDLSAPSVCAAGSDRLARALKRTIIEALHESGDDLPSPPPTTPPISPRMAAAGTPGAVQGTPPMRPRT